MITGELHYMLRADRLGECERQHIIQRMTELAMRFATEVSVDQDDSVEDVSYVVIQLTQSWAPSSDEFKASLDGLRTILERSCDRDAEIGLACSFECSIVYGEVDEAEPTRLYERIRYNA